METFEVHLASDINLSSSLKNEILTIGFLPVRIAQTHHLISLNELYSFYTDDKDKSISIFQQSKLLIQEHKEIPVLIESEKVIMQDLLTLEQVFCSISFRQSPFIKFLKNYGCFKGNYSKTKQADIHLSIPVEYMSPEFDRILNDFDITFIKVIREGIENIPGGCSPNEQWISYTMQLTGKYSIYNANIIYELLKNSCLKCGGFQKGIIKLEQVTDLYLTESHRGMPAIEANYKIAVS